MPIFGGGAGNGAMNLVERKTLAAGAASVTFTGLALAANGHYLLITKLKAGAAFTPLIDFNGDHTDVHYNWQGLLGQGATVVAETVAKRYMIDTSLANGQIITAESIITINNGYAIAINKLGAIVPTATGPDVCINYTAKTDATVVSITDISVLSSAAGASDFAIGSIFELYRVGF